MAVISTKELFDAYFDTLEESTVRHVRGMVDRPELYTYEQEIGKQLIDMNTDELIELLKRFYIKKENGNNAIPYSTVSHISTRFRDIFQFYLNKYEVIINPWNDKKLKGKAILEKISEINTSITWKQIENVIEKFRDDYSSDRADYLECLMRLFYEGFRNVQEVIELKEEMINFKTKEIHLFGRTIRLSDRCFELLLCVHNMTDTIDERNRMCRVISWNNSYFKFFVRIDFEDFDSKSISDVALSLNSKIAIDVRYKYKVQAKPNILYFLGFYDAMVERFGEEKTKEIITSRNDTNNNRLLLSFATEYRIKNADNITRLKNQLTLYI